MMDSSKRRTNPRAMTIINPVNEYWPSRGSNQQPLVLKLCTIPTELQGSANVYKETPLGLEKKPPQKTWNYLAMT